jgi:hypothetical protein
MEVRVAEGARWHVADAIGGDGLVIELQNSPLSPADVREREDFYTRTMGGMVWVFNFTGKWLQSRDIRVDETRCVSLLDMGDGTVVVLCPYPNGESRHERNARTGEDWPRIASKTVDIAEIQALLATQGLTGLRPMMDAHIEAVRKADEEEARRAEAARRLEEARKAKALAASEALAEARKVQEARDRETERERRAREDAWHAQRLEQKYSSLGMGPVPWLQTYASYDIYCHAKAHGQIKAMHFVRVMLETSPDKRQLVAEAIPFVDAIPEEVQKIATIYGAEIARLMEHRLTSVHPCLPPSV